MNQRFLCVAFTTLLLLVSTAALGQPRLKTEQDRKLEILKRFQKLGKCPTEKELRSFGSDADSILTDLINNPQLQLKYRLIAVDCMAYFRNKRSQQVLSGLLNDPTWDRPFLHRGMMAYARAFGETSLIYLKTFAQEKAPATRAAAVRAIGLIGTPRAISLLKRIQVLERDVTVLHAIDEVLTRNKNTPNL